MIIREGIRGKQGGDLRDGRGFSSVVKDGSLETKSEKTTDFKRGKVKITQL